MEKLFYPAVFNIAEEGGFFITFPDFQECITEGNSMEESYKMAAEALGLVITDYVENGHELPNPSTVNTIHIEDQQFVVIIEFDMLRYRMRCDNRSVSKNLTIPAWLNQIALEQNVNFSKTLQDALMKELHIH